MRETKLNDFFKVEILCQIDEMKDFFLVDDAFKFGFTSEIF